MGIGTDRGVASSDELQMGEAERRAMILQDPSPASLSTSCLSTSTLCIVVPEDAVRKAFPDGDIEFSYEATPTATSKFEVTINGKLVHSKIGDGGLMPAGFPDSEKKLTPVLEEIKAAMEK
eukprot:gene6750-3423_t